MRSSGKAPPPGIVEHIVDVLQALGPVEYQRFFGGWGLRLHGKQFGRVTRSEELYFSVDAALRDELITAGCAPFSFMKAKGLVVAEKLYSAPPGCVDDADELCLWAAKAIRAAGL